MAVTDDQAETLRYYARQHCSRQWVHFLAAMFAEFEERVDPAEADQFLETIGARMGRALPLRRCESLEDLTGEVNVVLEGVEWGWARISEADQYISITHGAYPVVPQDGGRRTWLVPVLEGLYTEWLGEQGGDPSLSARLSDHRGVAGTPLVFYYGRHD